jgi:hypothetical protein
VQVAAVRASTRSGDAAPDRNPLQTAFLALLPELETHARIAFCHSRCPDTRADQVAETLGLAWKR